MLGETLRQHFLQCGVQDTVKAQQTVSVTTRSAQDDLAGVLHELTDSHRGVAAHVERANRRVEYSLECRTKTMDALLHEWKSDLLRIWIPMVAGASLLVGMFGGMGIEGCRDSASPVSPTQLAVPAATPPSQRQAMERRKAETSGSVATRGQMRAFTAGDEDCGMAIMN